MKPPRVVSLVPSITENLILFGCTPVGRTSFCIEPKDRVASIPVVGGTKTPNIKKIVELKPDLVIANKEENRKVDVKVLRAKGLKLWVTYPTKVQDVPPLMRELARVTGVLNRANEEIILGCEEAIAKAEAASGKERRSVAALIWKDPWMAVGGETYGSDLMTLAGGDNVFAKQEGRYPVTTEEEILSLKPEILLLPSEPYAFTESDAQGWREKFRASKAETRVELFSGEDLSWFGPRVSRALADLRKLFGREGA